MDCLPLPGTDTIYANVDPTRSAPKKGDQILIENEIIPFQVMDCNLKTFTFSFTLSKNTLSFLERIPFLMPDDPIKLAFDVYELDCCMVRSSTNGFPPKSRFTIGSQCYIKEDGVAEEATIEASGLSQLGKLESVTIIRRGIFLSGDSTTCTISHHDGAQATLDVSMKRIGIKSRTLTVAHVWNRYDHTQAYINEVENIGGIRHGNVFIDKYEIKVASVIPEALGGKKNYSLITEFTHNLSLALLSPNCFRSEPIINRNFITLDAKISDLERTIEDLRRQLLGGE